MVPAGLGPRGEGVGDDASRDVPGARPGEVPGEEAGLKLETFLSRGVQVLTGSGNLKLGEGDGVLERAFDEAVAAGARFLVLDFSDLEWVDSAGVGAIARCAKRAAEKGAVLKIVAPVEGPVRRVFSVTQLDRAIEIFDDLGSAVGSFPV